MDRAAQYLVWAALLVAPIAFGATQAWSQEIIAALVWLAAACVGARLLMLPERPLSWSKAHLPILLFVLLVALQLLPLPHWLVHIISPATFRTKTALLAGSNGSATGFMTLSFYPWATRRELGLVITLGVLYMVMVDAFRDAASIRQTLVIIVASGLSVGGVALYQDIARPAQDYLLMVAPHPWSGPFMNHSHFAQFMNLSMGAALGLIAVRWAQLARRFRSLADVLAEVWQWRYWTVWLASLLCVLGSVTLFLSMSRGGVLALMVALILTAEVVARRADRMSRKAILLVLGIVTLVGICCCSSDMVLSRLTKAEDFSSRFGSAGTRVHILQDMGREICAYPLLGTGLGSFAMVFPSFSHSPAPFVAAYAENEFAQLLSECGAVGLALAIWFAWVVVQSYLAVTRRLERSIDYAAFGLGFGLIAIVIQSFTDYGQHLLANAMVVATFCGLLASLQQLAAADQPAEPKQASSRPPLQLPWTAAATRRLGGLRICTVLALSAIGAAVLIQANLARIAESHWDQAHQAALLLASTKWAGSDDSYRQLIQATQLAAAAEPDNAERAYWLNVFRWRAIGRGQDLIDGKLTLSPAQLAITRRIITQLQQDRRLCPTYGVPLCLAGELQSALSSGAAGLDELRTAVALTSYDPISRLALGTLEARQQQWDQSLADCRAYLRLGGNVQNVVGMFFRMNMPELAYQVAQDDRTALLGLARALKAAPESGQLALRCQQRADALLEQQALVAGATPQLMVELAELYRSQGLLDRSASLYQRALAIDEDQVVWRYRLAKILAQQDQRDDAVRQLQACLRVQPKMADARALLHDLTGHITD